MSWRVRCSKREVSGAGWDTGWAMALVTVEPGIYLPGQFGMRLEDLGVIGPEGFQRFTASTHELIVL